MPLLINQDLAATLLNASRWSWRQSARWKRLDCFSKWQFAFGHCTCSCQMCIVTFNKDDDPASKCSSVSTLSWNLLYEDSYVWRTSCKVPERNYILVSWMQLNYCICLPFVFSLEQALPLNVPNALFLSPFLKCTSEKWSVLSPLPQ